MARLRDIAFEAPTVLAPMAGVTDRDFRLIVRRIGGVGLVTMEFIQARGLVERNKQIVRLLHYTEEERPLSIQIYGSDPDTMAEAARKVEEMGADVCDINMGCPANKILKGCAGAALMGDLDLATAIVRAVRHAITIPLTVKFRLGLDERRRNFLELGRICEGEGAEAVTLHPRTAKQMFRGDAHWPSIAELREAVDIPVWGNGDIRTAEDAERMLRETGCAAVMVGRQATRNPWIFRQIADHLSGKVVTDATLEDRRRLMLDHFAAVLARDDASMAMHKIRSFASWYSQGLPNGLALRRTLSEHRCAEEVIAAVETHFTRLAQHEAAA